MSRQPHRDAGARAVSGQAPFSAPPPRSPELTSDHVAPVDPAKTSALHAEYLRTRDPEVRSRLLECYQGLAYKIAARFSRPENREDVTQVALLSLLRAIDRFDPARGVQFSTFAWATIRGEIKRHYRSDSWGLHVPRRLQETYLRTAAAIDELTHTLGRSPTMAEIAESTGLTVEDVVEAIEVRHAGRLVSLDGPAADDGGRPLQLGHDDEGLDSVDRRGVLSLLLERLPARERRILHLRFVEDLTQVEIAARVGLSQMHVSRLLARSLEQLRAWAATDAGQSAGGVTRPEKLRAMADEAAERP